MVNNVKEKRPSFRAEEQSKSQITKRISCIGNAVAGVPKYEN